MWQDIRRCLALLAPSLRWRWALLIPVVLAAAAAETIGAAAVFGLIKIIGDPSQAATLPVARAVIDRLPTRDPHSVVLAFTVLVMAFYVARNALLAAAVYAQETVAAASAADLSHRLLDGYLAAPYAFHFRRNSAVVIRRITEGVDTVFRRVLSSAVTVVTESLVVVGIAAILAATAPLPTLAAVVVIIALLLLPFRLTRHLFGRWGQEIKRLDSGILQALHQSLGGLKEVKITGRERFFSREFAWRQQAAGAVRARHASLAATMRMLVEAVFVCALLLVSLLVTLRTDGAADAVPMLALFAYAGFRVIPSANRLMLNVTQIRYGRALLEDVYQDVATFARHAAEESPPEHADITFDDAIALHDVTYAYEDGERVLADIRLTIRRGESIGIVGATGAGKTTLLDLLLGLLTPTRGRITVDGRDIRTGLRSWQRRIGYVPQTTFLIDDSLRRNVAFGLADAQIDERRVEKAVRMAQLGEVAATLPQKLDTLIGERGVRLSGGQRQRVAIARALYTEPEVLVFDEATSALDTQTERELIAAIDALRGAKTLVVVAHRISTVRHCDRLVFLRDGRVAGVGAFDDLVASSADFRAVAADAG
jgi:ABC-type multidrug transport system fused ATPase/permease subunit